MERAARLAGQVDEFIASGLTVVIVGQGDPERAAAYAAKHDISVPILSDPTGDVYSAYGIGHWQPEQVFFDAPAEYLTHPPELGRDLMESRRQLGRPMVDDPWRAAAEFVIAQTGGSDWGIHTNTAKTSPILACSTLPPSSLVPPGSFEVVAYAAKDRVAGVR